MTKKINSVLKAISYLTCCTLLIGFMFPCAGYTHPATSTDKIFEQIKPSLLQIRIKLNSGNSIAGYGSGFFVSQTGLVITNYHVVSDIVMDPETYSLEYLKNDNTTGPLQIMAIDVRNDLAILQLKNDKTPFLPLQKTKLNKGNRCYSLGNPLHIGMSIVEGTYNGSVATEYNEFFHFTGAINPGMSGGPVVTENGVVLGVNKAIRLDGQMVGYVIPASYVSALIDKANIIPPRPNSELRADLNEQILAYQKEITNKLLEKPFITIDIGHGYHVPEKLTDFFDCGGYHTNTADKNYTINSTICTGNSAISVNEELYSAGITFSHDLIHSDHMGIKNFSSLCALFYEHSSDSKNSLKDNVGRYACKEDTVTSRKSTMRVILCERQYKELDGLYDVLMKIATLNEQKTSLQSTAKFSGFSHENGKRLAKRYLESVTWTP